MNIRKALHRMKRLYPIVNQVRRFSGRLLMRLFHAIHGIEKDTVLFSSYVGHGYSDNTRRISEALHALRPDLHIVWQFLPGRAPEDLPDYIKTIPARSLRALRAYSTARVFVDNMNRPQYMLKFPGQIYVQTWHGDRGFKKVLFDMGTGEPFPDGAQMDLAVSGSDFGSRVYRSALGYEGEILECGCPRNDILIANPPEAAARVRRTLNLPEGACVLLYAPTFRDATAGRKQPAGLDLARVCDALARPTGKKWISITRGHDQNRGIDSDALMDVSGYPETNELLLAVDMLITDYSSIGGDFMLLNRPVIYYQPDRERYDRALYFDPDASPLIVAHTEQELLDIVSKPLDAAGNCRAALDFFGVRESGHAAETVARWIAARLESNSP